MRQITTRARARRLGAPLCVALALVLFTVLVVSGCTTARRRTDPTNLLGTLRFRSDTTYDYFHHIYRSGSLYQEFRPVMVVDAIFEDPQYRELLVQMMAERYFLNPEQVQSLRAEHQREFDSWVEMLVFFYNGTNQSVRINRKDAAWRVLLRDDDGTLHAPAGFERIKPESATYEYIQLYFRGLDRWMEVYRIRFPKLAKTVVGQPIGDQPFELLVTGVEGTITMRWEDPGLFYRQPEAPDPPEPTADAEGQAATTAPGS